MTILPHREDFEAIQGLLFVPFRLCTILIELGAIICIHIVSLSIKDL